MIFPLAFKLSRLTITILLASLLHRNTTNHILKLNNMLRMWLPRTGLDLQGNSVVNLLPKINMSRQVRVLWLTPRDQISGKVYGKISKLRIIIKWKALTMELPLNHENKEAAGISWLNRDLNHPSLTSQADPSLIFQVTVTRLNHKDFLKTSC